jgi:hypothetical protein
LGDQKYNFIKLSETVTLFLKSVNLNFIEEREVGSLLELSGGVEVNIFENNIIFGPIIKNLNMNNVVCVMK